MATTTPVVSLAVPAATVFITITQTVEKALTSKTVAPSTVTVTATPLPSPTPYIFTTTFSAGICFVDIYLVLTCTLVIFIIRDFNRLVAIPLISSASGAIASALEWYINHPTLTFAQRRVVWNINQVFWFLQPLSLPLYSFFLLEKILKDRQRKLYLAIFLFIYLSFAGIKLSISIISDGWYTWKDVDALAVLLDNIQWGYYITQAGCELWSAYFLLRVFFKARERSRSLGLGGRHASLFASLLRSTEIRVASICCISVARLICYSNRTNKAQTFKDLAKFASAGLNCYPIVLQLDLVASRMMKLQAAADSTTPRGDNVRVVHENAGDGQGAEVIVGKSPAFAAQPFDSMQSDYARYGLMRSWMRRASAATSRRLSSANVTRKGSVAPGGGPGGGPMPQIPSQVTEITEASFSKSMPMSQNMSVINDIEKGPLSN